MNAGYIGLYTGTINEPHLPDTPTNSALKIHYISTTDVFVNTFTKYEKAGLDVNLVPRPPSSSHKEKGSGVTSPNPWASRSTEAL